MRSNFENPEYFEFKFKRKPKMWTIDQIHELYERSKARCDKRRLEKSKVQDEVISKIPINKGSHSIYYYRDGNKKNLHKFEFSYHQDFKGYGVSRGSVEFSNNKVAGREEQIDFILSNEESFRLGQRYYELSKLDTNLHYLVYRIMWDMVEKKLQNHFKDNQPPDVFIINIGSKKYYVQLDEQHRYGYKKFHLKNEYLDNVLEIK